MSSNEKPDLYALILNLSEEITKLRLVVVKLETQMAMRHECPSPGLCLTLQKSVESLERDRATIKGAGLAMKIMWAFIGAGGGAVIVHFLQLITPAK